MIELSRVIELSAGDRACRDRSTASRRGHLRFVAERSPVRSILLSFRASWVGAAGYRSASVDVTRLSRRQVAELQRVWRDLRSEQGAAEPPDTDDSVFRAGLDAWLTGVISSDGRLADTSLDDLLDLEREAKDHAVARAYVDRVVAVVVPRREAEPPWHAELADVIREHCRERGYGLSDGGRD